MVKAHDINKDIQSMAAKVGALAYSYDELHNENIKNQFHYDYQRLIQEFSQLKKITSEQAEENLIDMGILECLPHGEYKINVGKTTEAGGGLNFLGDVLFFLSAKDFSVKYHELAHSLQKQYNLFAEEKINPLYNIARSGLKNGEKENDKLLDQHNYKLYLNEMHSETFAFAALMLRAESNFDFLWQASRAYNNSIARNVVGFFSLGKTEYHGNMSKFYATQPVMKPLIKAIRKIRKEGRRKEFFDENGVIKDEKLARLCEDIVLKNAYSPRTLKAFFDYNIKDSHSKQEKGWRGETLGAVAQAPLMVIGLVQEGNILKTLKSICKHKILVRSQNKQVKKFTNQRKIYVNPELTALKEYERLLIKVTKLGIKNDSLRWQQQGMPDSYIRRYAELSNKTLEKELKSVKKIIDENRDNPYFEKLMLSNIKAAPLHRLIAEKQKNPHLEVTAGLERKKDIYSRTTFTLNTNLNLISNFANQYKLDPAIRKTVLDTMVKNPKKLEDMSIRRVWIEAQSIHNDVLGIKKKKFAKEFNALMDNVCSNHYHNNGNPLYQQALQELSKYPTEKFGEKIAEMAELEKQARKEQKTVKFVTEEPIQKGIPLSMSQIEPIVQGKNMSETSVSSSPTNVGLEKQKNISQIAALRQGHNPNLPDIINENISKDKTKADESAMVAEHRPVSTSHSEETRISNKLENGTKKRSIGRFFTMLRKGTNLRLNKTSKISQNNNNRPKSSNMMEKMSKLMRTKFSKSK